MRTLLSQLWFHQVKTPHCSSPADPLAAKLHLPDLVQLLHPSHRQAFAVFFRCLPNRKQVLWPCTLVSSSLPTGTSRWDGVFVCLMPWARQDCSCCSAWLAEGKVSGAPCCSGKSASSALPGAQLHPPKPNSTFLGCGQGKEAGCVPSYWGAVTPRGPAGGSGPSWAGAAKMKTDVFVADREAEAGCKVLETTKEKNKIT